MPAIFPIIEVVLRWFFAVWLAAPAFAADWVEYRSGPFHVFSDAGDRRGREALNELEQLRFVLGAALAGASGSTLGTRELTTVWPIDVVLFANQKEYAPHVLPKPLIEGGSALLAAWPAGVSKDAALPQDLLRAVTMLLIEDNATEHTGRLSGEIETALGDLMSTLRVKGTLVEWGAPLATGALAGDRLRAWAKLQMLATQPDFAGKLRVYLNNLEQSGEEAGAVRNAYDTTAEKLNERAAAYLREGKFEAAPVTGRALAPSRDFIEKETPKPAMDALLAELDARGKTFPPGSPRALLAQNTLSSLELAAKANSRWAEPHFKMAALETDRAKKIADLKAAASLAPRNPDYWQTLATEQAAANLFADAEKSWVAAERAAPDDAERARIHQAKLDLQDQRAAFEVEEKRREREEAARDLQRVKDEAAAEVHAAERAANERLAAGQGNIANPVPWFGDAGDSSGAAASGTLTRVDCLAGGSLRLTILQETGRPVSLLIRDPKKLMIAVDSGDAVFACGAQKPARKIEVRHDAKADAKSGTLGNITVVKFP